MKTTVINLRTHRGLVDIVLIDRRTEYGNPHRIGAWSDRFQRKMTREDVLVLFQEDFDRNIKEPAFRARVRRLAGKKIAGWCAPFACHGDTYVQWLEGDTYVQWLETERRRGVWLEDADNYFCFGNFSEGACNECVVVNKCVKELERRNTERKDSG